MIIGAQRWRAIVLAARFERRSMESAHFLAAPGGEGDMQMPCRLFAGAKPEFLAAVASQPALPSNSIATLIPSGAKAAT